MNSARFARLRRRASLLRWAALGAGIASLAACDRAADGPLAGQPVAAVEVSPAVLSIPVGESRPLAAALRAGDGRALNGRAVAWASEDESIAVVDAAGRVTARGPGAVVITATSEGRKGRSTVTVPTQPVASLTILGDTVVALEQGASRQLIAIPRAADGTDLNNRPPVWASSDERIVWVSSTGGIVAHGWGEAVVTATVEGVTARLRVRVLSDVIALELEPAYLWLAVGETQMVHPTIRTRSGHLPNRPIAWASEDSSVATVVNNRITGRAAGSTYVTATLDGSTARVRVDVREWEEYALERVDGAALPGTVREETVVDPDGVSRTYRWSVTEGAIRFLPTSRYQRRFTFRIHVDGRLVGTETLVERGTVLYDMWDGSMILQSQDQPDLPTGRARVLSDGALVMTQRDAEGATERSYLFRRR